MTSEWAQVLVAAITVLGVLYTAHQSNAAKTAAKGASHQAKGASKHAAEAAEYSKPTGNGFAVAVRTELANIATIATDGRDAALRAEAKSDATAEVVARHLEAHATAGLQVVQGGR